MSPTPITRADGPNEGHPSNSTGHIRAFNFIGALARHDPAMPLGAILVLLYLYEKREMDQGVSLRTLRKDLGMTSTIATRSI